MAQSRTLAILHAAIHDALNAIDRRFESYTPGLAEAPGASADAAVAAAARDVLVGLAARPVRAGRSGVRPRAGRHRRRPGQGRGHRCRPGVGRSERRTPAGRRVGTARRSRCMSRGPGRGNISSRRRSTSPRSPDGDACTPFVIDLPITRSKGRCACRAALRARPRVREGDRRDRQHDPHARAVGDRAVLVRGFAARLEPDREHRRPPATTSTPGRRRVRSPS